MSECGQTGETGLERILSRLIFLCPCHLLQDILWGSCGHTTQYQQASLCHVALNLTSLFQAVQFSWSSLSSPQAQQWDIEPCLPPRCTLSCPLSKHLCSFFWLTPVRFSQLLGIRILDSGHASKWLDLSEDTMKKPVRSMARNLCWCWSMHPEFRGTPWADAALARGRGSLCNVCHMLGGGVSVTGGCYSETVMTAPSIAVSVTAITWYREMISVECLGDKEAFVTRMDFPFLVTQLEEVLRLNSVNLPHVDCSVLSGILRTDRTFKSLIPITWYLLYSINQGNCFFLEAHFFFFFSVVWIWNNWVCECVWHWSTCLFGFK